MSQPETYPALNRRERWERSSQISQARLRNIVTLIFLVIILLEIVTVLWRVGGVPVRALAAVGGLALFSALRPEALRAVVSVHRGTLILIGLFAVLGVTVSLFNSTATHIVLTQALEIYVQSAVNLLLAAMVAELCGVRRMMTVLVGVIALTGVFAIAQFFGVDAAWRIREFLRDFTNEPPYWFSRERAVGLSLTTINLASQLCLGFLGFGILRQREFEAKGQGRAFDWMMVAAVAVLVFACLASGNRSPILGTIAFLALYALMRAPRLLILSLPFVILSFPVYDFIMNHLQSTGLRAFETGDKSSVGRFALTAYGFRLFLDHPLGYGLDFDPTRYWGIYWQDLLQHENPEPIRVYPLHNYVLNMLNYYGAFLLLLLPVVYVVARRSGSILIYFVPYFVHMLFHNGGPLWSDALFFLFVAGAPPYLYQKQAALPGRGAAR